MEEKTLTTISQQELHQKMSDPDAFVLLDTLTNDHFSKVHLPGAHNACVFEVTFLDQVAKITSDKECEIILYGSSDKSMDAPTAAEKLLRAGYRNVSALEGGLRQWHGLGYELEGEAPEELVEPEKPFIPEVGTYLVDTEQSLIEWTGRNPNTKHFGTLKLSGGEISVKDGVISGTFEIDMKSIKNINLEGDPLQPVLIAHLLSDDFFFVKMFPKATFTIKSATPIEDPTFSSPNFEVKGTLELRGVKKEIRFPATVNPLPDGHVNIEAHFDIDRTRWKVIYGSSRFFEHLGMHLVYDLISIQLRLLVRKG